VSSASGQQPRSVRHVLVYLSDRCQGLVENPQRSEVPELGNRKRRCTGEYLLTCDKLGDEKWEHRGGLCLYTKYLVS